MSFSPCGLIRLGQFFDQLFFVRNLLLGLCLGSHGSCGDLFRIVVARLQSAGILRRFMVDFASFLGFRVRVRASLLCLVGLDGCVFECLFRRDG